MKTVTVINTPQSRCRAGVARCDITPPIGIYHRMWGAALQDQATGVHRPLEATLLWIEPHPPATGATTWLMLTTQLLPKASI